MPGRRRTADDEEEDGRVAEPAEDSAADSAGEEALNGEDADAGKAADETDYANDDESEEEAEF